MTTTRTAALLGLACLLAAPAAAARPAPPVADAFAYRYELRALGATAGEAVYTVGEVQTVGGKALRPIRVEAETTGLAGRLLKVIADGTTWVDPTLLPVRAKWGGSIPSGQRDVDATFAGSRIRGEYRRNGQLLRKVNEAPKLRATDIVSGFAWMMTQPLEPGTVLQRPIYDGRYVFDMAAHVGQPEEIHVPVGVRKAVPVKVVVTRGSFKREVVYWIGADDRVPYKLSFSYGVLGSVDVVLVARRKVERKA